jgi:hypothetical protein
VVRRGQPERHNPVVAVTGRRDLVRVTTADAAAVSKRLLSVPVSEQWSNGHESQWVLSREDIPEMETLCEELSGLGATVENDLGSVTVLGHDLGNNAEVSEAVGAAFEGYRSHTAVLTWTAWMPAAKVNDVTALLHSQLIA